MIETLTKEAVKYIHESKYAADVAIALHYDGSGWDPTIDSADVEKLDRVSFALRNGHLAAAAKEAKVYELSPISA